MSSSTPATSDSSDSTSNPPPAPAPSPQPAALAPAPQPPAPPAPVPVAMVIPTPSSKGVSFEGLHSSNNADAGSDVPYAVAQPTPGSLPPIATTRPLNNISNFNSHLGGGSNIPMVNGQPQHGFGMAMHQQHEQGQHLPYIATQMPTGADYEHSPFEFMDKCRWVAGIMLAYYVGTFLFLQPFFMGVVGMLTGFIGYYGARAPMDLVRMKWIRSYIWLNYIMVGFNLWLLAITFLFIGSASVSSATDIDSEDDDTYLYTSRGLGLLVALLVACNMLIHIRGIQTSHAFYAELVRAHMQNAPTVVIIANMA